MSEDTAAPSSVSTSHPSSERYEDASPGLRIPAPFVHLASIAVALALRSVAPWPLMDAAVAWWIGATIVTSVALVSFRSAWEFARAGTSMLPYRPSRRLITTGPFRFSRNPIYLCLVVIHFGIGVWINSGWLAVSALPCVPILDRLFIRREERYLEQRFGAPYREYCARVRRWI